MKLKKIFCLAMTSIMSLSLLGNNTYALENEFSVPNMAENYISNGYFETNVIANNVIGKTNLNTSIYGYDLEDNMIEQSPEISSFIIHGSNVNVNGYVNKCDVNTAYNLVGTAYKTFDGNIVCNATDTTGNYDVLFLCLEKGQENNDYILYRNGRSGVKGDYGLKVYLMKKGTRDISIIEDTDVEILNAQNILDFLEDTDYTNLNWFTKCFEPVPDVEPYYGDYSRETYLFIDTETYYFGSVAVQLGFKLTATNNTPPVLGSNTFVSKLNHEYYVYSTNPSYNQPARADGYFGVENLKIKSSIGAGYYLQQVHWNASGSYVLGASLSANLYVGFGSILGGNINASFYPQGFDTTHSAVLMDKNVTTRDTYPRVVEVEYEDLYIRTPSDYAEFSATVEDGYASSRNDFYQTIWSFDVTKKSFWGGYDPYKTNQTLYCYGSFTNMRS